MTKSDEPREVTVVSVGSVVYMETKGTFTLDHHKERRDVYVVADGKVALAGDHWIGNLVPPDPLLGKPEFRPGLATVEVAPRTSTVKINPAEAMKLARHDEAPTVDEYLAARERLEASVLEALEVAPVKVERGDAPEVMVAAYASGARPAPGESTPAFLARLRLAKEVDSPVAVPAMTGHRTPVEHPAPWRWIEDEDAELEDPEDPAPLILVDANGEQLIGVDDQSELAPFVDLASPRVQALTEAAPQLERLLRVLLSRLDHFGDAEVKEARALLAQIEERSRG